MARAIDPVCGMTIDTDNAAARVDYGGQRYYFCSEQCATAFRAEPARFVGAGTGAGSAGSANAGRERHEPPYTTDGMTAPKFGSAGSGGAEYEQLPERHDKR